MKTKLTARNGYEAITRFEALEGYGLSPKWTKAGHVELSPADQKKLLGLLAAYVRESATVQCPDCGLVTVAAEIFEHGKPIAGECPKCEEMLYFA